ncbi:MAG: hypothetical protein ACOCQ5_00040 [Halanaerobiales bacterium]
MGKIKSSYEIAMQKAKEISKNTSSEEESRLEIRDELKSILADFYQEELDAEGLWVELEDKDEDYLIEAQLLIIESFGLRTTEKDFNKRKEALLGIESLKNKSHSSRIEQTLNKINQLQQQHQQQRENLENQLQQEAENSQMQMKPVQTEDGRTVMKLEQGVDQETKQRYNKAISELENKSSQRFSLLIEELEEVISN